MKKFFKELAKNCLYLIGMVAAGAAVAVVSIIVKTIIKYYWGT